MINHRINKLFIFLLSLIFSCTERKPSPHKSNVLEENNQVVSSDFQAILDSAGVNGSILILFDSTYYSNNFKWAK